MKRDSGYYWVRFIEAGPWRIAQWWKDTDWFYCGIEGDMPEPKVIGPKIESPPEAESIASELYTDAG